ncbi:methyltransferase domain-containing protein [Candidatus Woesearchaeota archaeon]|nr:methyltransferase domain-containing protein [Candidatus Woesearchaeota archaeon]
MPLKKNNKLAAEAYNQIFPGYPKELERAVKGCKTLLDIGCGENSPVRHFSQKPYSTGVDAFGPSIKKSKAEGIHDRYCRMNILEIGKRFKPSSFDCVLASDVIEHLPKTEGLRLLRMMEKIAAKKAIVFTPNGFLPQGEFGNNPWQKHKSGWTAEEMKSMGYSITGINGWKPLRGAYAMIKLRPRLFWSLVSDLTQLFTRSHPKQAFQILCVKEKGAKHDIRL